MTAATPRLADVCAAALADIYLGDGEILANPIGLLPRLGGELARATTEPLLMMTDGGARLTTAPDAEGTIATEFYNPYRSMFDIVWWGRRHVAMGASQLDSYGNQNLAAIGDDYQRPVRQLIGFRGAPSNTVHNVTSYWIPRHSTRVLVPQVDVVTGVGWDRAREAGIEDRFEIRRVVSNLAVMDFDTPERRMRLVSVHPGVTIDEVIAATGFELVIDGDVATTRAPTSEELHLLNTSFDVDGARFREVPDRS